MPVKKSVRRGARAHKRSRSYVFIDYRAILARQLLPRAAPRHTGVTGNPENIDFSLSFHKNYTIVIYFKLTFQILAHKARQELILGLLIIIFRSDSEFEVRLS